MKTRDLDNALMELMQNLSKINKDDVVNHSMSFESYVGRGRVFMESLQMLYGDIVSGSARGKFTNMNYEVRIGEHVFRRGHFPYGYVIVTQAKTDGDPTATPEMVEYDESDLNHGRWEFQVQKHSASSVLHHEPYIDDPRSQSVVNRQNTYIGLEFLRLVYAIQHVRGHDLPPFPMEI